MFLEKVIFLFTQTIVSSNAFDYDLLDYWYSNDDGIVRSGEIGIDRYVNENYSSIPNRVALRTTDDDFFEVELGNNDDEIVREESGQHVHENDLSNLSIVNYSALEDIVENSTESVLEENWHLTSINPEITEINDSDNVGDAGLKDESIGDSLLTGDYNNYSSKSIEKETDNGQVLEDNYSHISPIKELFDKLKVSNGLDFLWSVSKNDLQESLCVNGAKIKNECSLCTCVGGHLYVCKMIECPSNKMPEKCVIGSLYSLGEDKRNQCYCVDGVISFCFMNYYTIGFQPDNQNRTCKAAQEFVVGQQNSCYVCTCEEDFWFCRNNNLCHSGSTQCTAGRLTKSDNEPCMMCLCLSQDNNVCAMDVKCNQHVKERRDKWDSLFCSSGDCTTYCYNMKLESPLLGFCDENKKCQCL